ncbi:MAG: thioredoxin family protein [Acidobacteriota bacterium]
MRRLAVTVVFLVGGLAVIAGGLMLTNPAPAVRRLSGAADSATPFVVKFHARWCPVCMTTKDVWATVQAEYGERVRLVVFDFTSDGTTEASRREARRLGLERVFEDHVGETGTVLVLDGATREVKYSLHGDREAAHYRDAIDAVLSVDPSGPARLSLLDGGLEEGQTLSHERW